MPRIIGIEPSIAYSMILVLHPISPIVVRQKVVKCVETYSIFSGRKRLDPFFGAAVAWNQLNFSTL